MEKKGAVNLTVESSLPYQVDASLETEIKSQDGANILDKSILGIKPNSDSNYKTFVSIKNPVTLLDNQESGQTNNHDIDFKLNKGVNYVADTYKTTIKLEVKQK